MIPTSADQLKSWTPETLANAPVPPVFLFKPTTWRDEGRLQDRMVSEGLTFHDNEALDAELLRALKDLSSPDVFEKESVLLISTLSSIRSGGEVAPELVGETMALIDMVRENWPRYNKMAAQNQAFYRMWPKIVLSMTLAGWKGLKTPFRREGGWIPFDTLAELQTELDGLDADLADDQRGASFMLLAAEGAAGMGLTESQRKNSPSESPSSGILDGSTPAGTTGSSPQSAQSRASRVRKKSASGPPATPARKMKKA